MNKIFAIGCITVWTSCAKVDVSLPTHYVFEDGFETENNDLPELFPSDESRWSNVQQVNPVSGPNSIEINSTVVHSGNNSLRIYAEAADSLLSKADIEKSGFIAPEGSTVRISASIYIGSLKPIENLLLMDLECCSCWDPSVPDNQCPGIRLMMKNNDYLSIERGKIFNTTLVQSDMPFPRKEWVRVEWELTLSQQNDGWNRLYINDQEVISVSGANMPNAELFQIAFAPIGIDFTLQEPVFYERFQIGATANPTAFGVELYLDDVRLEIIN